MDIKKKVEELALTLPECPVPLAAYVPATRFGDTIVVSGQLPSIKGDFSAYCGTVPTELPVEKATEAARICLLNNIAAVKGVPESVARDIWQTLRAWEDDAARTQDAAQAKDAAQAPGADRGPAVHDVQPEG